MSQISDELNYSQQRRVKNEVMFKKLNLRIEEAATSLLRQASVASSDFQVDFACECSNATCLEKIPLNTTIYHRLHAEPNWFVLLPGHEQPDIEKVVQRFDGYLVVVKTKRPLA